MPEDFNSEFRKIVFKTDEISLQRLIFILVRLEVLILLFSNLFAKIDLLECIQELLDESVVLIFLLLFVYIASVRLLFVNRIDVLL